MVCLVDVRGQKRLGRLVQMVAEQVVEAAATYPLLTTSKLGTPTLNYLQEIGLQVHVCVRTYLIV